MGNKHELDEHLEKLWYLKEEDNTSLIDFKKIMEKEFSDRIINELFEEGFLDLEANKDKIALTKKGENAARILIRAHRLAERLLHDVMGGDFETGACEFEHTINPELVNSICILLGHPKECPHGLPIPPGDCCKASRKTTQSSVSPVTELNIGDCARVAYVHSECDQQLHKINGLHIRPGITIKLHQTYPSYVIECEGVNIALDKEVAQNICVWKQACECDKDQEEDNSEKKPRKKRLRLGLRKAEKK